MRRPGSRTLAYAGIVAVVLVLFFLPAIGGSGQFLYRDSGRLHAPVKQWIATELAQGTLPQWNPRVGLGMPVVAGSVDAVLHPFTLLLAGLPFDAAFKAWVLLSYALAALGGFAWARALGRSEPAAAATAVACSLAGHLVSSSDNLTYLTTLSAVPLLFATVTRAAAKFTPGSIAALGLASYLCAAGGDPQAWGTAVALMPAYLLLVATRSGEKGWSWQRGVRALAGPAVAAVGAAPIVLPVLAWLGQTSRAGALEPFDRMRWNLPVARVAELVLPNLFRVPTGSLQSDAYLALSGTEIPWVLSVYAGAAVVAIAILGAASDRRAAWLVAGAVLLLWLATGPNGGLLPLLSQAPVVRGIRYWEKVAIWPAFLLASAMAFGIDRLQEPPVPRGFLFGTAAAAALALASAVLLAGSRGALLHAGMVLGALAASLAFLAPKSRVRFLAPVLLLLVAGDLAVANFGVYLLSDPVVVRPPSEFARYLAAQPGLQRVVTIFGSTGQAEPGLRPFEAEWRWSARMLEPDFGVPGRVANWDVYTGLAPARMKELGRRMPLQDQGRRLGLFGVAWSPVAESPAVAAGVLGLPLDVAAHDPAVPAWLLRLPHRPRAYLASEVVEVSAAGALDFVLGADPAGPVSVVESPPPAGHRPPEGGARIVVDEPDRVELTVNVGAPGPALLVLNDLDAPGWTATLDGAPASIQTVNYLARGVWVPAGSHQIGFGYRTPGLAAGWLVFTMGVVTLAAWQGVRKRSRGLAGSRSS